MVAILSRQREAILEAVRAMYTEVASAPRTPFHFPTGRAACVFVGYPESVLDTLPATALESFAGVGYPFAAGAVLPGDTVLDVGSGSGTDALIASRTVGPGGRVIALDMTEAMRAKLAQSAAAAGAANVELLPGNAEAVPLPDASVDAVTSNGVLNLVPDKRRAVGEIFRVLRPGGRVQVADVVLGRPVSEACRGDPQLWAECVVGATPEADYLRLFRSAGFTEVEVLSRLDYFAGSSSPETREVAELFGALSIVLRARKPDDGEHAVEEHDAAEVADPGAPTLLERGSVRADIVLDTGARGCGEVTPLARRELKAMAPGRVLGIRSEVPEAATELAAWCRMTGHTFVGSEPPEGGAQLHLIRRRPD